MQFKTRKHKNITRLLDDKRRTVGIECNRYFTSDTWSQNFKQFFPDCEQTCQLIYFSNDYEKYALAPALNSICTTWIDQVFLDAASKLKWIFIMQSGIEFLETLKPDNNLKITTAAGISSEGVAEYVLCVSLMLLRNLHHAVVNQNKRKWEQNIFLQDDMHFIKEKRIGILGVGHNGIAVAQLFKSLGCYVMGYDSAPLASDYLDHLFGVDQLSQIVEQSDILVICLPLTSTTKNLITSKELQLLGKKGILINVARGEIVNESDLAYALQKRIISSAALDVFSKEPLPPFHKLWNCSNVIITPHIAGNINNYVNQIQTAFIKELKNFSNL